MNHRIRYTAGIALLVAFVALSGCKIPEAESAPIIRYASVILRPGAPTASGGFQAATGSLYSRSDVDAIYVKTGTSATAWGQIAGSSGSTSTFDSIAVNNNSTLGNGTTDVVTVNGTLTEQNPPVSGIGLTIQASAILGSTNAHVTTITGHPVVTGTAPTLSACGTSPSIVGGDGAFRVTTGSAASTCTITFSRTWTVKPACAVLGAGASVPACTWTATAITCTVVTASLEYSFVCMGVTGSS